LALPIGDPARNVTGPLVPRLDAMNPDEGAAAYTDILADPCCSTCDEILFRLPSDPLGTPSPAEFF